MFELNPAEIDSPLEAFELSEAGGRKGLILFDALTSLLIQFS